VTWETLLLILWSDSFLLLRSATKMWQLIIGTQTSHSCIICWKRKQPCWQQWRKINVKFHPNFCLKNQRLSWTIIWQRVAWTRDKMCASYSVSRVTRRWPLAVFYILMNIAGINSWVIYTINTPSDELQCRILFLKNLSLSLMKEHLISRSQIPSLPRDVSAFLEKYRPLPVEDDWDGITGRPLKKWGSCFICGQQKNSSASLKCYQCNWFICKQHSKKQIICANCGDANIITSSECE